MVLIFCDVANVLGLRGVCSNADGGCACLLQCNAQQYLLCGSAFECRLHESDMHYLPAVWSSGLLFACLQFGSGPICTLLSFACIFIFSMIVWVAVTHSATNMLGFSYITQVADSCGQSCTELY